MEIKHLLFDLDGTLLPMVQEEFVKFYMPLWQKRIWRQESGSIQRNL